MGNSTQPPFSSTPQQIIESSPRGCSAIATKSKTLFDKFDTNHDGLIDRHEFNEFLDAVFTTTSAVDNSHAEIRRKTFALFDVDHDDVLNYAEFDSLLCSRWMHAVLGPVSAFLVVDVQNDFIDGTLALKNCPAGQDGADVVPLINCMLEKHAKSFKLIVFTQDWHPLDHCSFAENVRMRKVASTSKVTAENAKPFDVVVYEGPPRTEQKLWPAHCVQGSRGAEIHSALKVPENAVFVRKADKSDIDCYSGFGNPTLNYKTELQQLLESHGITDVFVCGLASDICAHETMMDAVRLGFRTVFIEDAARGVSLEGIAATRKAFVDAGGYITTSDKMEELLSGRNRPIELAWQSLANASENYLKRANLDEK